MRSVFPRSFTPRVCSTSCQVPPFFSAENQGWKRHLQEEGYVVIADLLESADVREALRLLLLDLKSLGSVLQSRNFWLGTAVFWNVVGWVNGSEHGSLFGSSKQQVKSMVSRGMNFTASVIYTDIHTGLTYC